MCPYNREHTFHETDFDLPDISYASANDEDDEYEPAPKKRRGRKKGSKNKPKVDQSQAQTRNFIKASDDPMTEGQKARYAVKATNRFV